MRRRLPAVLVASVFALSWAVPAEAATTYTQVSLSVSVNPQNVTATAVVKASATTSVAGYGFCPKDANGVAVTFASRPAATITTTGTQVSKTVPLAPGSYTIVPCVNPGTGWQPVGDPRSFTVPGASSTPTPTPTSSPAPTPTPTLTPTPTPSPTTPASGSVLFSDDFSGAGSYDHSKWGEWSACTYESSAAYANIQCGDRATLDGQGHLVIPATPTQGTSISTADHFSFTYGTVTARMLIPTDGGYWPAFWTLNNYPHPQPADAPVMGEADVLEAYTSLANGYRRSLHNWSGSTTWSPASGPVCNVGHTLGEWHDYSAKFEPGRVTFFFDGQMCGAVTTKAEGNGKPYGFGPDITRGNWLILTLAVGGAGGQQNGKAVRPSQLLVDSVVVKAL